MSFVAIPFGSGWASRSERALLLAVAYHIRIQLPLSRREAWIFATPSTIPLSRTQIIKEDGFAFTSKHPQLGRKCLLVSTSRIPFEHPSSSWSTTLFRSVKAISLYIPRRVCS